MRVMLLLTLLAAAGPAHGQEAYLDDRSTPAAVVKSLYNAINRGEFARAYSYFAKPPAPSVDAYAKGYDDTESVVVMTGAPSDEGAAGSIVYRLPVAIEATNLGGQINVFAGCYTLRMANPGMQGDSFEPLRIERGSLRASQAELSESIPKSCGDGPPLPEWNAALETAKAMFADTAPQLCRDGQANAFEDDAEPQSHQIGFRYDYETDADPEHLVTLFRFFCHRGAYNESHVYYLADETGEVTPLQFARPALDIRYEDDDHEKAVEGIRIVGFTTSPWLVNSDYDPQTRTIGEFSKWRGIGDASTTATWAFYQGSFRLVRYDVDASYDGEIEHETVVDYESAP